MHDKTVIWKPHVTVAAIVESSHCFLMVEEQVTEGIRFNQPAGHLEENESLIDAIIRECQEETAWRFEPEYLLGIYRTKVGPITYLRFAFTGRCLLHNPAAPLDDGIIAAHWMTLDEIRQKKAELRSPTVLQSIQDYLQGVRYPLSLLSDIQQE
ncbi:MAG: NUDIX hydrolase [Gammaproteobacteria bacterium]